MPERLLSLVAAMLPAFQEIEKRLDRETGRRFNVFDNIFVTNETVTSRILAFLLDPSESHGQSEVFLQAFIQHFVPEWDSSFNCAVARRASADEAVDVTITDGQRWLGIENKIFDAQEQHRQVGRYLDALKRTPGCVDYRLIYITPRGSRPTEYSFPAKDKENHKARFACAAWTTESDGGERSNIHSGNIVEWLIDCRNQCSAESVSWLIRQFSSYIDAVVAGRKESRHG